MNQLARSSSQLGAIIQRQRRQLGLTQTQLGQAHRTASGHHLTSGDWRLECSPEHPARHTGRT